MLTDLSSFLLALLKQWKAAAMITLLAIAIGGYEHEVGHAISWRNYVLFLDLFVLWASFGVYRELNAQVEGFSATSSTEGWYDILGPSQDSQHIRYLLKVPVTFSQKRSTDTTVSVLGLRIKDASECLVVNLSVAERWKKAGDFSGSKTTLDVAGGRTVEADVDAEVSTPNKKDSGLPPAVRGELLLRETLAGDLHPVPFVLRWEEQPGPVLESIPPQEREGIWKRLR